MLASYVWVVGSECSIGEGAAVGMGGWGVRGLVVAVAVVLGHAQGLEPRPSSTAVTDLGAAQVATVKEDAQLAAELPGAGTVKEANRRPLQPAEQDRSWWVVYDCIAVASTVLAVGLSVRCCSGAAGSAAAGHVDTPQKEEEIVKGSLASGTAAAAELAVPPVKPSPPASTLSSCEVSAGLSSRGSTRTSNSGSSSRSRFPSKPISAAAEARRQQRMREGISGLVARRPMVWPDGVKPQDYINDRDWVTWMTQEEEEAAILQLKELVADLRDEKGGPADLFLSDMTLYRYLRARKGDAEAAASMLEETIAWRQASGVAQDRIDCPMCCERPGTHTWRQIGFDRRAMPVIYSCAKQEPAGVKVQPQDSNMHMLYALEEAIKTMEPGVTQWVWALDMSGFGMRHASPQLPLHMNALFSRHYPELLGTALIINAPRIFSALWSWIERFVDPNTVAKVRFVNGTRETIRPVLQELFPDELAEWLEEEIVLNRKSKLIPQQKTWWEPPPHGSDHDPRASPFMLHCYCDPQAPRNVSSGHPGQYQQSDILLAVALSHFAACYIECRIIARTRLSVRMSGQEDSNVFRSLHWTPCGWASRLKATAGPHTCINGYDGMCRLYTTR